MCVYGVRFFGWLPQQGKEDLMLCEREVKKVPIKQSQPKKCIDLTQLVCIIFFSLGLCDQMDRSEKNNGKKNKKGNQMS